MLSPNTSEGVDSVVSSDYTLFFSDITPILLSSRVFRCSRQGDRAGVAEEAMLHYLEKPTVGQVLPSSLSLGAFSAQEDRECTGRLGFCL